MDRSSDDGVVVRFGDFELDVAAFELRRHGNVVHTEPMVFDLLHCLAISAGRVLTRDEIVDKVWDGRAISDSTISSCIKAARKALGDSGETQRYIKTIRGRGFQFTGEVSTKAAEPITPVTALQQRDSRPSIVVLPFQVLAGSQDHPAIAEALAHDIIQSLSRLRWLRVIARGSAFRFRGHDGALDILKTKLDARYCLTGSIELDGANIGLTCELIDLIDHTEVWVDRISGRLDDIHDLRNRVVDHTTACVETHIPIHEARLAQTVAPENLDAWSAFHLGLVNMYRFNERSMHTAIGLFERAIALEPTFARAHAGLSFAQFQLAFNEYPGIDRPDAISRAFASAERGLELDPLDPFCNFTHGRAFWLSGDLDKSLPWFQRATDISPSFAQGHYATAFTSAMIHQPDAARVAAQRATSLSPLDPFLWAFLCVQAITFIAEGDYEQARVFANRAALEPGSIIVIDLMAVVANDLAGDTVQAAKWAERARTRRPDAGVTFLMQALQFQDQGMRRTVTEALRRHGF